MIYFIQCNGSDGPIKIGYTSGNVEDRLASMQCHNPYKMKILHQCVGGKRREEEIQARFSHLRIRGEWYRPDREILSAIGCRHWAWKILIATKRSVLARLICWLSGAVPLSELGTLNDLAKLTGIPRHRLTYAAKRGYLETHKIGHVTISTLAAIDRAVESNRLSAGDFAEDAVSDTSPNKGRQEC